MIVVHFCVDRVAPRSGNIFSHVASGKDIPQFYDILIAAESLKLA